MDGAVREGRVVPLRRGGGSGRQAAALQEVRAYWEALRGDAGEVPYRRQVDPRGIAGALDHAFLAERIAPGVARLRLAGMHLADLMGMEVRGMPLSALALPEARAALAEWVERVFAGPAAVEIALRGARGLGRPPLAATMLLLPLRSDAGEVNRALGCLVAEGAIGRTPRRLEVVAGAEARLPPLPPPPCAAPARPDLPRPAPAVPARPGAAPDGPSAGGGAPGLAEDAPAFVHRPPRPRGRPLLRLVKSDR